MFNDDHLVELVGSVPTPLQEVLLAGRLPEQRPGALSEVGAVVDKLGTHLVQFTAAAQREWTLTQQALQGAAQQPLSQLLDSVTVASASVAEAAPKIGGATLEFAEESLASQLAMIMMALRVEWTVLAGVGNPVAGAAAIEETLPSVIAEKAAFDAAAAATIHEMTGLELSLGSLLRRGVVGAARIGAEQSAFTLAADAVSGTRVEPKNLAKDFLQGAGSAFVGHLVTGTVVHFKAGLQYSALGRLGVGFGSGAIMVGAGAALTRHWDWSQLLGGALNGALLGFAGRHDHPTAEGAQTFAAGDAASSAHPSDDIPAVISEETKAEAKKIYYRIMRFAHPDRNRPELQTYSEQAAQAWEVVEGRNTGRSAPYTPQQAVQTLRDLHDNLMADLGLSTTSPTTAKSPPRQRPSTHPTQPLALTTAPATPHSRETDTSAPSPKSRTAVSHPSAEPPPETGQSQTGDTTAIHHNDTHAETSSQTRQPPAHHTETTPHHTTATDPVHPHPNPRHTDPSESEPSALDQEPRQQPPTTQHQSPKPEHTVSQHISPTPLALDATARLPASGANEQEGQTGGVQAANQTTVSNDDHRTTRATEPPRSRKTARTPTSAVDEQASHAGAENLTRRDPPLGFHYLGIPGAGVAGEAHEGRRLVEPRRSADDAPQWAEPRDRMSWSRNPPGNSDDYGQAPGTSTERADAPVSLTRYPAPAAPPAVEPALTPTSEDQFRHAQHRARSATPETKESVNTVRPERDIDESRRREVEYHVDVAPGQGTLLAVDIPHGDAAVIVYPNETDIHAGGRTVVPIDDAYSVLASEHLRSELTGDFSEADIAAVWTSIYSRMPSEWDHALTNVMTSKVFARARNWQVIDQRELMQIMGIVLTEYVEASYARSGWKIAFDEQFDPGHSNINTLLAASDIDMVHDALLSSDAGYRSQLLRMGKRPVPANHEAVTAFESALQEVVDERAARPVGGDEFPMSGRISTSSSASAPITPDRRWPFILDATLAEVNGVLSHDDLILCARMLAARFPSFCEIQPGGRSAGGEPMWLFSVHPDATAVADPADREWAFIFMSAHRGERPAVAVVIALMHWWTMGARSIGLEVLLELDVDGVRVVEKLLDDFRRIPHERVARYSLFEGAMRIFDRPACSPSVDSIKKYPSEAREVHPRQIEWNDGRWPPELLVLYRTHRRRGHRTVVSIHGSDYGDRYVLVADERVGVEIGERVERASQDGGFPLTYVSSDDPTLKVFAPGVYRMEAVSFNEHQRNFNAFRREALKESPERARRYGEEVNYIVIETQLFRPTRDPHLTIGEAIDIWGPRAERLSSLFDILKGGPPTRFYESAYSLLVALKEIIVEMQESIAERPEAAEEPAILFYQFDQSVRAAVEMLHHCDLRIAGGTATSVTSYIRNILDELISKWCDFLQEIFELVPISARSNALYVASILVDTIENDGRSSSRPSAASEASDRAADAPDGNAEPPSANQRTISQGVRGSGDMAQAPERSPFGRLGGDTPDPGVPEVREGHRLLEPRRQPDEAYQWGEPRGRMLWPRNPAGNFRDHGRAFDQRGIEPSGPESPPPPVSISGDPPSEEAESAMDYTAAGDGAVPPELHAWLAGLDDGDQVLADLTTIYDWLRANHDGAGLAADPPDVAIVVGSANEIGHAALVANLTKRGSRYPVVFTGYRGEAEEFATHALKNGLSEDRIVLETFARNTQQNILLARKALAELPSDSRGPQPLRSIVIYCAPPHAERIHRTAKKNWPGVDIVVVTVDVPLTVYMTYGHRRNPTVPAEPTDTAHAIIGEVHRLRTHSVHGYAEKGPIPDPVSDAFDRLTVTFPARRGTTSERRIPFSRTANPILVATEVSDAIGGTGGTGLHPALVEMLRRTLLDSSRDGAVTIAPGQHPLRIAIRLHDDETDVAALDLHTAADDEPAAGWIALASLRISPDGGDAAANCTALAEALLHAGAHAITAVLPTDALASMISTARDAVTADGDLRLNLDVRRELSGEWAVVASLCDDAGPRTELAFGARSTVDGARSRAPFHYAWHIRVGDSIEQVTNVTSAVASSVLGDWTTREPPSGGIDSLIRNAVPHMPSGGDRASAPLVVELRSDGWAGNEALTVALRSPIDSTLITELVIRERPQQPLAPALRVDSPTRDDPIAVDGLAEAPGTTAVSAVQGTAAVEADQHEAVPISATTITAGMASAEYTLGLFRRSGNVGDIPPPRIEEATHPEVEQQTPHTRLLRAQDNRRWIQELGAPGAVITGALAAAPTARCDLFMDCYDHTVTATLDYELIDSLRPVTATLARHNISWTEDLAAGGHQQLRFDLPADNTRARDELDFRIAKIAGRIAHLTEADIQRPADFANINSEIAAVRLAPTIEPGSLTQLRTLRLGERVAAVTHVDLAATQAAWPQPARIAAQRAVAGIVDSIPLDRRFGKVYATPLPGQRLYLRIDVVGRGIPHHRLATTMANLGVERESWSVRRPGQNRHQLAIRLNLPSAVNPSEARRAHIPSDSRWARQDDIGDAAERAAPRRADVESEPPRRPHTGTDGPALNRYPTGRGDRQLPPNPRREARIHLDPTAGTSASEAARGLETLATHWPADGRDGIVDTIRDDDPARGIVREPRSTLHNPNEYRLAGNEIDSAVLAALGMPNESIAAVLHVPAESIPLLISRVHDKHGILGGTIELSARLDIKELRRAHRWLAGEHEIQMLNEKETALLKLLGSNDLAREEENVTPERIRRDRLAQAAERIGITRTGVKWRLGRIIDKLHVRNLAGAIAAARLSREVSFDDLEPVTLRGGGRLIDSVYDTR
ncbi:ElyC/SanA/YdcF family protein [Nocardia sp. NBC_00511]|uniref:ElyC/SanA/YdcF family protein n=1 Tax=Nocardia sp. NBC_00511 TaxID=2903591 RepID=UPI002F91A191